MRCAAIALIVEPGPMREPWDQARAGSHGLGVLGAALQHVAVHHRYAHEHKQRGHGQRSYHGPEVFEIQHVVRKPNKVRSRIKRIHPIERLAVVGGKKSLQSGFISSINELEID